MRFGSDDSSRHLDDGRHGRGRGLGRIGMALLSALLTWFILAIIGRAEHRMSARRAARATPLRREAKFNECLKRNGADDF